MEFEIIIIGAGPAGLATAIRLAQLGYKSICVLEKGAAIGSHILAGAVIEPNSLTELLPNWQDSDAPLNTPVTSDHFWLLSSKRSYKLPTPPQMRNDGNYIISLGSLCRWLAEQAENLGVEIYPGFAATDCIIEDGKVCGIFAGEHRIQAQHTILAEGAHGSVTKKIIQEFTLDKDCDPQTYGLGIKELWQVPYENLSPGKVIHTIGWPLSNDTYGGSFIYHMQPNLLSLGFVVGLDYPNPYLNPFAELQRFKHHPDIAPQLQHGNCIGYGARCITEGGWQSLPKLEFPGGVLVGCAAGMVNVPKIKGIHTAIKSGMLAAESIYEKTSFQSKFNASWVASELKAVRNIRPGFQKGLWRGLINAAFDTYIWRGHAPWTFKNHADHLQLKPAKDCKLIRYPRADQKISFDRTTLLQYSNFRYTEGAPSHLIINNPSLPVEVNYAIYQAPEQRYCPAGVYEYLQDEQQKIYLQINAGNCLQCKACDIKDPQQNITWTPATDGGGPNYSSM